MDGKKAYTRFTVQFSRIDPLHLQVAEILNRQGRRGKAQYIVNAVLHYERCDEAPDTKRPARIDEKVIEAVINRILRDRAETGPISPANHTPVRQEGKPPRAIEEIRFDDAVEMLGEAGFNAVAAALDMFRKK